MKDQYIHINSSGEKFYCSDKKMKTLHREDGPAVEYSNGDKVWYVNGKLHREDGPAIEYANGYKAWYVNGKIHREDGPAIEIADGYKAWYVSGKRHREDGPAIERADGYKEWWVNGKYACFTEEQFNAKQKEIVLTIDEIAAKFGVEVNKLKIKK